MEEPVSPPDTPPLSSSAASGVLGSIRQASRATHVDFNYLVAEAEQESGLNPHAAASSSSARGLFQFVDTTWLDMMRRFGGRYGAGQYASQIGVDRAGRPTVAEPGLRRQILNLRNDPALSAALAAEYARENQQDLKQALGRPPSNTDLYLAHFLGPGGATEFLRQLQRRAAAPAAALFPHAAAANRSVFYDRRTGAARSVAAVYRIFAGKLEGQTDAFERAMDAAAPSAAGGAMMPLASAQPARAFPLLRSRGPMPLIMQRSAPLVAMFNVLARSAMNAMGGSPTTPERRTRTAIAPAPAAPAAAAWQSADTLA